MANFLLVYHGGGMPETPEEQATVMAAWGAWMEEVGDGMVDMGNPTSNVQTVSTAGIAEFSGDRVSGYSIVKADSLDQASELAKGVPLVAEGGSVDVYEIHPAM